MDKKKKSLQDTEVKSSTKQKAVTYVLLRLTTPSLYGKRGWTCHNLL